jgi:sugar phosphate isomerase/epimerase
MTSDSDLVAQYWTVSGRGPADAEAGHGWSPFSLEERCAAAQRLGFRGIGLFWADIEHLLEDRALADIRRVLDEHDIAVLELEYLWDWFLPAEDPRRQAADRVQELLFSAAAELGARHVKVGNIAGAPCARDELTRRFAELCDRAAERHDALIVYEFTPFDPNVGGLDAALALVGGAGRPNGAVALDTWHLAKLGIEPDELRRIPPELIGWVELSDGRFHGDVDLGAEGVDHRHVPGEGEFPLADYVAVCRELGYDGPWGVEVLSAAERALPMEEMFRRAHAGGEATVRAGRGPRSLLTETPPE